MSREYRLRTRLIDGREWGINLANRVILTRAVALGETSRQSLVLLLWRRAVNEVDARYVLVHCIVLSSVVRSFVRLSPDSG